MRARALLLNLVLLSALLPAATAHALTPQKALERFFAAEELQEDWFAPSFLAAVPFAQLQPIRDRLTGDLGDFLEVVPDGDRWLGRFQEGDVPAYASLDDQGRFVGLRMLLPIPRLKDLAQVAERFEALPGAGHLLVRVDGEERLAVEAGLPFAVGSAFKLVILRALQEEIEGGRRAWDDVVHLQAEDRPLGDGQLGSWPVGSPLTLHTAATLMISRSDNTATDLLLRILGRERVEAADPSGRNRPFLSTAEAFRLKNPDNAELLRRWLDADEAGRRALLDEVDRAPLPSLEIFAPGTPIAPEVEWFFTARELCDLLEQVQSLDLTGVNPGVLNADRYRRVAFKGGSEPGVLNLTTWAEDEQGRRICVCATRNAPQSVDEVDLGGIVTAAFEVLRGD